MNKLVKIFNGIFVFSASLVLASCDSSTKLKNCKFIEIEGPVGEFKSDSIGIEGGEVEMLCGDKILDVAWRHFRTRFQIDPKQYKNNLQALEAQVNCFRDEYTKNQEILCNKPGNHKNLAILNFTYDN